MIVEIKAQANGAHRNATSSFCPEGWVEVPETVSVPDSFPFVTLTVEGGVLTRMDSAAVPETVDPDPPTDPKEERIAAIEEAIDFILMGGENDG